MLKLTSGANSYEGTSTSGYVGIFPELWSFNPSQSWLRHNTSRIAEQKIRVLDLLKHCTWGPTKLLELKTLNSISSVYREKRFKRPPKGVWQAGGRLEFTTNTSPLRDKDFLIHVFVWTIRLVATSIFINHPVWLDYSLRKKWGTNLPHQLQEWLPVINYCKRHEQPIEIFN